LVDKIPLVEVKDVMRTDNILIQLFEQWDTNGNGLLSRQEFEQVANVLLMCCSCVAHVLLMCCSCVAHVLLKVTS
jgi:hypothetical protein